MGSITGLAMALVHAKENVLSHLNDAQLGFWLMKIAGIWRFPCIGIEDRTFITAGKYLLKQIDKTVGVFEMLHCKNVNIGGQAYTSIFENCYSYIMKHHCHIPDGIFFVHVYLYVRYDINQSVHS